MDPYRRNDVRNWGHGFDSTRRGYDRRNDYRGDFSRRDDYRRDQDNRRDFHRSDDRRMDFGRDGNRNRGNNQSRFPQKRRADDSNYYRQAKQMKICDEDTSEYLDRESVHDRSPVRSTDMEEKTDEEKEMITTMGFAGFRSTKGLYLKINPQSRISYQEMMDDGY